MLQDIFYALRQLFRAPAFTVTAIVTLGLGIGVNAAMFSVIDQVLLRPLPYRDPGQIVLFGGEQPGGSFSVTSLPDIQDYRARSRSFQQVGFWTIQVPTLGGVANPRVVPQVLASSTLFDLLGVAPARGRTFLPADGKSANSNVVVLGDGIWRDLYGSDPHIVGRVIPINSSPYIVIGVMPPQFQFPVGAGPHAIWTPVPEDDKSRQDRGSSSLQAVARLRPGVSTAQASSELNGIHQQLKRSYPKDENADGIQLASYHDVLTRNSRPGLVALDAAVLAVWLIACANIAGLLLTRANNRRREIAIRATLGAMRGRLVRQFLTESLLLSLAGGLVGLAVAFAALRLLRRYLQNAILFGADVHINIPVAAYLLLASVLSALVFGLVPAWIAARSSPQSGLREGAPTGHTGKRQSLLRDGLIAGEIALTLVLLFAAGLMLRTLIALRNVDLGFRPDHVVTGAIYVPNRTANFLSTSEHPGSNMVQSFYVPLQERLSHLPGVQSVGLTTVRPLNNSFSFDLTVEFRGRAKPEKSSGMDAQARATTADYFRTLGIRLLRGRFFSAQDAASAPPVAIVNQAFVRRFLPGVDPIGQGVRLNDQGSRQWADIVGVVDDTRQRSAAETALPEIHFDLTQLQPEDDLYSILGTFHMDVAVRASGHPEDLIPAITRTIHDLQPEAAFDDVRTMTQIVNDSMGNQVLASRLLLIFAAAALGIAIAGIYGLLAYSVSQRTREFGIRLALGAQRRQMLQLVLRHSANLIGIGLLAGLVLAWFARNVLSSFLYGVHSYDIVTVAAVALVLSFFGLLASYFPARRAAAIEPMDSLRME